MPQFAFNTATDWISQEQNMLGWALTFFVLAVIAAAFGFGGIAGASASIAQVLFVIFLVLTVIAFIVRAIQGRSVVETEPDLKLERAGHAPALLLVSRVSPDRSSCAIVRAPGRRRRDGSVRRAGCRDRGWCRPSA